VFKPILFKPTDSRTNRSSSRRPLKAAYVKAQMYFFLVYAVISERILKALGRMFRVG